MLARPPPLGHPSGQPGGGVASLDSPNRKIWSCDIQNTLGRSCSIGTLYVRTCTFDFFFKYKNFLFSYIHIHIHNAKLPLQRLSDKFCPRIESTKCSLVHLIWSPCTFRTFHCLPICLFEVQLPYEPSCPSVGWLVGRSVCWSVRHNFRNRARSYTFRAIVNIQLSIYVW